MRYEIKGLPVGGPFCVGAESIWKNVLVCKYANVQIMDDWAFVQPPGWAALCDYGRMIIKKGLQIPARYRGKR